MCVNPSMESLSVINLNNQCQKCIKENSCLFSKNTNSKDKIQIIDELPKTIDGIKDLARQNLFCSFL